MRFILNDDYVPPAEGTASEFDAPPEGDEKQEEEHKE
jgi:hypothetical protein